MTKYNLSKLIQAVDNFYKMAQVGEDNLKPMRDGMGVPMKDADGKPLFLDADEEFDIDQQNLVYQDGSPVPFNKVPYWLKKPGQVDYIKPSRDGMGVQYKDLSGLPIFENNVKQYFYENHKPIPANKLPWYLKK